MRLKDHLIIFLKGVPIMALFLGAARLVAWAIETAHLYDLMMSMVTLAITYVFGLIVHGIQTEYRNRRSYP